MFSLAESLSSAGLLSSGLQLEMRSSVSFSPCSSSAPPHSWGKDSPDPSFDFPSRGDGEGLVSLPC